MKNTFALLIVIILLTSTLLSACSGATKLDGSSWQLTTLNGEKLPIYIQISLDFKEGQAGGKAPCNSYGAGYTQKGSNLTFEPAVSTLMYCDGVMEYESAYLDAFGAVKSFELENDELSLLDENGAVVLVFGKSQAPTLEGSSWKVTQVGETIVPETMEVTLSFEDGKINGRAACNNYFGAFSQQGKQLTFSEAAATKMFCDGAGIMEMETAFLNSLAQVRSFEIQMGGLVLLDGSGMAVIYLRP